MNAIETRPDNATELALLRLLLGDPRLDPDELDWSVVLQVAERQGVLLRLAAWFDQRRETPPPPIAAAFARARERLDCIVDLIARLEERCARRQVSHVFLKLAQQYPDVGRDIDVLVDGNALDAAEVLAGRASAQRTTLRGRLAGTTECPVPECAVTVVAYHGRLGRLGQHELYARQILARRRVVKHGETGWPVPSPEDALLLRALDRVYGHPALKVRDAHWTITTIRDGNLDWDYLIDAARANGLLAGLSCFLDYADQIYQQLAGKTLIPAEVRQRLTSSAWGQVRFEGGAYRFPAARVAGRLYLREFFADLLQGRWAAAARLLLLPIVAAVAGWRRLARPALEGF